jgi:hypothetical protein
MGRIWHAADLERAECVPTGCGKAIRGKLSWRGAAVRHFTRFGMVELCEHPSVMGTLTEAASLGAQAQATYHSNDKPDDSTQCGPHHLHNQARRDGGPLSGLGARLGCAPRRVL